MKLNSIFYFILISYIYSKTNFTVNDIKIDPEGPSGFPLASVIDPNNNLIFIYCSERIYTINYINGQQNSSGRFENDNSLTSFEIGKNGSMIVIYYNSIVVEAIKDNNQGYQTNKYYVYDVSDVFSIGNIENGGLL